MEKTSFRLCNDDAINLQTIIKWLITLKLGSLGISLLLVNNHCKGPVKLIQQVKTAHSFLQYMPSQFHVITLSLLM